MSRTARLTDALRGRGKALVFLGAAAALAGVGAGTASAGTAAPAAGAVSLLGATSHATASASSVPAAVSILGATSHVGSPVFDVAAPAPFRQAAPHTVPAQRAAVRIQLASRRHPTQHGASQHPATARPPAAPARHAATARHAAPAQPARPYLIYDSVTPSAIPAHHEVATYATGGYAVPASQVAGRRVLWIDTNGSDPAAAALDVEPGDATPSLAASWAWQKLHAQPTSEAIIYTMRSEWPAAQAAVAHLPAQMRSHVRWWIADPTGYPHVVPGSDATQWYWGSSYDITTATPGLQQPAHVATPA